MIAAAVVVTLIQSAPAPLPGVALSSTVLLPVERAAAMFAIVVALAEAQKLAAVPMSVAPLETYLDATAGRR